MVLVFTMGGVFTSFGAAVATAPDAQPKVNVYAFDHEVIDELVSGDIGGWYTAGAIDVFDTIPVSGASVASTIEEVLAENVFGITTGDSSTYLSYGNDTYSTPFNYINFINGTLFVDYNDGAISKLDMGSYGSLIFYYEIERTVFSCSLIHTLDERHNGRSGDEAALSHYNFEQRRREDRFIAFVNEEAGSQNDGMEDINAVASPLGIYLNWTVTDAAQGYYIYRSTVKTQAGELINDKPAYGGKFIDANVQSNTMYYYSVYKLGDNNNTPFGKAGVQTLDITDEVEGNRGFMLMQIGKETMIVNGDIIEIDPGRGTTPILKNSRTLIPIRAIAEAMNGEVSWNEYEEQVDISANGRALTMWIDNLNISVGGVIYTMDVAPEVINARTMLPVRFVVENLGCVIDWFAWSEEVVIVYPLGD